LPEQQRRDRGDDKDSGHAEETNLWTQPIRDPAKGHHADHACGHGARIEDGKRAAAKLLGRHILQHDPQDGSKRRERGTNQPEVRGNKVSEHGERSVMRLFHDCA
jgi:hypothetical protein